MKVKPLLQKLNSSTFLDDLLTVYGVRDVETYLRPNSTCFDDWANYPNMDKAVELVDQAVKNKWKIGVLVDKDCDGFMSAGIIVQFLKSLGSNPIPFFHEDKAHGLSNDVFGTIQEANLDLLILPDSGTNNSKRCSKLYNSGTYILVLDHHNVDTENADAVVVNPLLSPYLNHALSGAGVTYKFVEAYCETYELECPNYNDMVALSIVSDVCDLASEENRGYLEIGLNVDHPEEDKKYIPNPMLDLMFSELAKNATTPRDCSWSIAPKINALTRLNNPESDATFFSALVGETSIEDGLTVAKKAHAEQTKLVKKIVEDIEPTLDHNHNVIIAYIDAKDKNFTGLVANKIMGKYHKPTIILREANEKSYSGSIRSPIPIATLINDTGMAKAQGHENACGVVLSKENVDSLIKWFDTQDLEIDPETPVTAIVTTRQMTTKICKVCVDNTHLWGHGVEQPTFYIKGTVDLSKVNFYRKRTTTIKFTIDNMDFLKFRAKEEDIEAFEQSGKFDIEIIFTPSLNEWNGRTSVQGIIESYELNPHVESNNWEDDF